MAHRTFVDRIGMTWQVWDVRPNTLVLSKADRPGKQEFASGWLCFQSGSTRKRLVPIPLGWADMSEDDLVRLWRTATPAPSRGPSAADQAPSSDSCFSEPAAVRDPARPGVEQALGTSARTAVPPDRTAS
jgi:hypothetical protein